MAVKETTPKSIWDLEPYHIYQPFFEDRRNALMARDAYYNGKAYSGVALDGLSSFDHNKMAYFNKVKAQAAGINQKLAGLIDPISTVVDVDTGLVPGGWELHPDSARHQAAVDALFHDVNFIEEGDLFVNYGARMGMSTFLIVDDRPNKRVDIQALNPATVLPFYGPGRSTSRELSMVIIVEQNGENEEAQVITRDEIRMYVNGQPQAIYGNQAVYPNRLGFIPLVDQPYISDGDPFGRCAYQDVIRQLVAINSTVSQLSENIRKNANPQWVIMTDDEMPDAPIGRSDEKLWKLSASGGVEAIVASLDIQGVAAHIDSTYEKMEKKLPQFLLHQLVGVNRIAAETIRIQLLPLVIHIDRVRRSLDAGVVRTLQMAGKVAAQMGIDALAELNDPALKLNPARRVIPVDEGVLLDLQMKRLQLAVQEDVLAAQQAMSISEGDTADG